MSEIDLIPQAYRDRLKLERRIKFYLLSLVVLMLAIGAARLTLGYMRNGAEPEMARLQKAEAEATQRRNVINQLTVAKHNAQEQVNVLVGLRGKPIVDGLYGAFDRAMVEGIWFDDFRYMRAGQMVDAKTEAVKTGYFIILPKEEGKTSAGEKALHIQQHVEIRGQAIEHAVLAEFIRKLSAQPRISNVRLVNTSIRQHGAVESVEFQVIASIEQDEANKPQ